MAFRHVILCLALFVVLKVFLTHGVFCTRLPALQILDKNTIPWAGWEALLIELGTRGSILFPGHGAGLGLVPWRTSH